MRRQAARSGPFVLAIALPSWAGSLPKAEQREVASQGQSTRPGANLVRFLQDRLAAHGSRSDVFEARWQTDFPIEGDSQCARANRVTHIRDSEVPSPRFPSEAASSQDRFHFHATAWAKAVQRGLGAYPKDQWREILMNLVCEEIGSQFPFSHT